MLSQRVKAAMVFVPLVLLFIYLGGWLFNLFILALLLLAANEYAKLCKHMGHQVSLWLIFIGITLFVFQRWFFHGAYLGPLLTVIIMAVGVLALVEYEQGKDNAVTLLVLNLFGILYLGWVGASFITFRAMDDGLGWLLTALPAVWLADSGAYFVGSWLGNSKMTPRLSPNKTWAGLIGEVISGALFGTLLVLLWRAVTFLPAGTPLWQGAVMGFFLSVMTPMGDLLISLFKRTAGVKDTGDLIPGHGGFLDRIDTWIWAALLGYYIVRLFNLF